MKFVDATFLGEPTNRIRQSGYVSRRIDIRSYVVWWGKNLIVKAYLNMILANDFSDMAAFADPRTFGGRIEFAF